MLIMRRPGTVEKATGGKAAPATKKINKVGSGAVDTAGNAAKNVSGTAQGAAKDVSGTASGAAGNLAKTGKVPAGAVGRGDFKGTGKALAKGTGATVGAAGQGVRFPSMLRTVDRC